jgi:hypothetical protein
MRDAPTITPSAPTPSAGSCRERTVLADRFLEAVAVNIETGKNIANMKSPEWREATKDSRADCEEALLALNESTAADFWPLKQCLPLCGAPRHVFERTFP